MSSSAKSPTPSDGGPKEESSITASTTSAAAMAKPATTTPEPTDQAVLQYLKQRGLLTAVAELSNLLDNKTTEKAEKSDGTVTRTMLAAEEAESRTEKHLLTKSTGGNYGYDRDAVWPVVQWGIPDASDSANVKKIGYSEARAHIDALVSLQVWILSLPEANEIDGTVVMPYGNPLERAQKLIEGDAVPLESVIETLAQPAIKTTQKTATSISLPRSSKPELLAVGFCLLVHTYCELLEWGMESTALSMRDAFSCVYEPLYPAEFRDLQACTTAEEIIRLNSHNSQHMDAITSLKSILVQIASYQLSREQLRASSSSGGAAATSQELQKYDQSIARLKEKYAELSERATTAFGKMVNLPFLRRVRAVRWQLTLSTNTYGLLQHFLHSEENLLSMSALLQIKCELHVERRDPLPFVPACVLENDDQESNNGVPRIDLHDIPIEWAAPSANPEDDKLPFPPYKLREEYESAPEATKAKQRVEFNRALLIHGFRRLQTLERKRQFDSMSKESREALESDELYRAPSAIDPSILLTTVGNQGDESAPKTFLRNDVSSLWKDEGSSVTCGAVCPPDGQRVAIGCDDAAVRIYDVAKGSRQVLLGHQNGFPVFDVSWNRDGRALLSAGGDGSIRLWDTALAGPFGETVDPSSANKKKPKTETSVDSMSVPGAHDETYANASGAALCVYRGHVPGTPVWSVEFSPAGYYFCTTGADSTARIWTTDRPVPVRLLTGHTSRNVNCVTWHPNANYVLTGSDDRTARLWDIQTGRTVRLLTGCNAGVSTVAVSPGGRYAAGADCKGVVHLWDLGSGRKVTEFRASRPNQRELLNTMIHTISFSPCGSALATGGDDCCIRIWDVKKPCMSEPLISKPAKTFGTKQAMILDLHYTKRNLLLSVGKFVSPMLTTN